MEILDGRKLNETLIHLFNEHNSMYFAVAWASKDTDILNMIYDNYNKIKQGIIGTEFFNTDPDVLKDNIGSKSIHFMMYNRKKGVFHPKVYLFSSSRDKWDIIIGSANMTYHAFKFNDEVCVHINNDDADYSFKKTIKNMINIFFRKSISITETEANNYKMKYEFYNNKIVHASLEEIAPDNELFSMKWDDYIEYIYRTEDACEKLFGYRRVENACNLLNLARNSFLNNNEFRNIEWNNNTNRNLAKAIAGLVQYYYLDDDYEEYIDCGCFGYYANYYWLRKAVEDDKINGLLSNAINCIPNDGIITKENFLQSIEIFQKIKGIHVAGVTRLLSMKRPDYFLSVNNENRTKLMEIFNIDDILHNIDSAEVYWDKVVKRIIVSPWWNSDIPNNNNDHQIDIWNGRSAMLDMILYTLQRIEKKQAC